MPVLIADTSLEAYEAVKPHLSNMQERILDLALDCPGGITLSLTAEQLGMLTHSASGCFTALRKAGKIVDSGRRWANSRGRNETVWEAV